ncbi:hypothetical protein [uncultured Faecalibaculum sp.]|uniref:hypothetical protein n=1 Tax=uncultured Faecalibaculum sp. TaxID=1729681 RepID=UPI0025FF90CC|nr:hypothetical protein [uncultured Faecalibaculum sp.]
MKRMKYELIYLAKPLLPLYLATLAVAALHRLPGSEPTGWMQLLQGGLGILTTILGAASLLLTLLASWNSFYRNNFKPEATVLHSLPVSRGTLWLTFVLPGLLFVTLSLLTVLAAMLLWTPNSLAVSLRLILDQNPDSGFHLIELIAAGAWLQMMVYWLCGMTGMALGLQQHGARLGWSVLAGIGLYLVIMLLMVGLIILQTGPAFFGDESALSVMQLQQLFRSIAGAYVLADLVLLVLGQILYARGFDLE